MLRHLLRALHSEDRGQDLAEYCLLTALVALIGMVIFVHLSGGMQALWSGRQHLTDRRQRSHFRNLR